MKPKSKVALVAVIVLLCSCRVYQVRPGPASDQEQFDRDSGECHQVAVADGKDDTYAADRYRGCMRARGHTVEIRNRFTGTVTPAGTMTLSERLESMKGKSINDAIVRWGAPAATQKLDDGTTVYTWRFPWTSSGVNYAVAGGAIESSQHVCTLVIQADAAGIIRHYRWNDCVN